MRSSITQSQNPSYSLKVYSDRRGSITEARRNSETSKHGSRPFAYLSTFLIYAKRDDTPAPLTSPHLKNTCDSIITRGRLITLNSRAVVFYNRKFDEEIILKKRRYRRRSR